ncbi:MAG: sporulation initiation factor Spo0A C-terminal domain-containing protein [Candidatus Izemoplasmatales bacterium]|nr:sporulation initiation factor Spo0A C-terminal domain-containing protein [Candidatus Izemoplasmatales bacterium]
MKKVNIITPSNEKLPSNFVTACNQLQEEYKSTEVKFKAYVLKNQDVDATQTLKDIANADVMIIVSSMYFGVSINMICSMIKDVNPSLHIIVCELSENGMPKNFTDKLMEVPVDCILSNPKDINIIKYIINYGIKKNNESTDQLLIPSERQINKESSVKETEIKTVTEMTDDEIKKLISQIFREIGCSVNLIGFAYAVDSIFYLVRYGHDNKIVTTVYGYAAKEATNKGRETTANRVERAIRHMIENLFNNGKSNFVLSNKFNPDKGKPTNTEFLKYIADSIINGWYQEILDENK